MVEKLFDGLPPESADRILYPGCGTGPFIGAVYRYCDENGYDAPEGVAVELDPELLKQARESYGDRDVEFLERDFLRDTGDLDGFDYVVGNPPYVPIEGLGEEEKQWFKREYETANGRFDLFALFFERSLQLLDEGGRLCFVTPEKFEYTGSTRPLRELLAGYDVEEIHHVDEDSFGDLVTYPTVTTVNKRSGGDTRIVSRDGDERVVELPEDGSSWASVVRGGAPDLETGVTLEDVCERVSCGVATGADSVFVMPEDEVPEQLAEYTFPTTSGKQLRLNDGPDSGEVFVCPYDERGRLLQEDELDALGDWLELHRDRLEDRSCVEKDNHEWYRWHENPPMQDVLQPKLVCKDVTEEPYFWKDETGDVLPRHSVYYLVPEDNVDLEELQSYLNGGDVQAWLEANCQRAANDFLRLQSTVLKQVPVPEEFVDVKQTKLP